MCAIAAWDLSGRAQGSAQRNSACSCADWPLLVGLKTFQQDPDYSAWREAQKEVPKSKRATRKIIQILTKEFNQLSGTMESVHQRIAHLKEFLGNVTPGPERTAFCLSLIETALNNAVEMMIETPKFGFPVAMVLTGLFAQAPELPRLFRGMVKSADYGCPLCVPEFTPFKRPGVQLSVDDWKRANGFKCAHSLWLLH
jgi:hypothetical protein